MAFFHGLACSPSIVRAAKAVSLLFPVLGPRVSLLPPKQVRLRYTVQPFGNQPRLLELKDYCMIAGQTSLLENEGHFVIPTNRVLFSTKKMQGREDRGRLSNCKALTCYSWHGCMYRSREVLFVRVGQRGILDLYRALGRHGNFMSPTRGIVMHEEKAMFSVECPQGRFARILCNYIGGVVGLHSRILRIRTAAAEGD